MQPDEVSCLESERRWFLHSHAPCVISEVMCQLEECLMLLGGCMAPLTTATPTTTLATENNNNNNEDNDVNSNNNNNGNSLLPPKPVALSVDEILAQSRRRPKPTTSSTESPLQKNKASSHRKQQHQQQDDGEKIISFKSSDQNFSGFVSVEGWSCVEGEFHLQFQRMRSGPSSYEIEIRPTRPWRLGQVQNAHRLCWDALKELEKCPHVEIEKKKKVGEEETAEETTFENAAKKTKEENSDDDDDDDYSFFGKQSKKKKKDQPSNPPPLPEVKIFFPSLSPGRELWDVLRCSLLNTLKYVRNATSQMLISSARVFPTSLPDARVFHPRLPADLIVEFCVSGDCLSAQALVVKSSGSQIGLSSSSSSNGGYFFKPGDCAVVMGRSVEIVDVTRVQCHVPRFGQAVEKMDKALKTLSNLQLQLDALY